MKVLYKNPFTIWIKWLVQSRLNLFRNRGKHLKIGYLTKLEGVKLGKYNTFYDNIQAINSSFGDFVYVSSFTSINNARIGSFCSIGPNVRIGLGMHPTHFISTFPAFYSSRKQCQLTFPNQNFYEEIGKINIGSDVWIGYGAIILDNITIGDGAVIGAGAVVTRNVPPYAIVGGVPAKIIRKRYNDQEVYKLIEFKWWDKDLDWLKKNADAFQNPEKFFRIIS